MITSLDQLDLDKTYTYADYLTWQFKERVELWRGRIARMSPAPNIRHQEVSWELVRLLGNHLHRQHCKAFAAPVDVRLPLPKGAQKGGKTDTVVQPDICVVCDLSKLDDQGCNGAPDLVIEILSPGNTKREMKSKYELYESAGVQEYWLVHPVEEYVVVHILMESGTYQASKHLLEEEIIPSQVLPDLQLKAEDIFYR
jgi:Uma2 family endonuclease